MNILGLISQLIGIKTLRLTKLNSKTEVLLTLCIICITFSDITCHLMLIFEHPIQITVVRQELNTSRGVVKLP